MTEDPRLTWVQVFKASPIGDREVPDGILRIVLDQPSEELSLEQTLEHRKADAEKIADVLQRSLPGGTLVALTALLLSRASDRYLAVPVFVAPKPDPQPAGQAPVPPFVSRTCGGEKCSLCGAPATTKVGESIAHDDPFANRHNLTAYVCADHFRAIMGNRGVDRVEDSQRAIMRGD